MNPPADVAQALRSNRSASASEPADRPDGGADDAPPAATTPAAPPAAPVAFRCGARPVTINDIFEAAECLGELEPFAAKWTACAAAAAAAHAAGLQPDPGSINRAIETFRYARDLISAEECEQWLAARGLTASDLVESCERRELAALGQGLVCEGPADLARDAWLRDALLADAFDRWARHLSARLATAAEDGIVLRPEERIRDRWSELESAYAAAEARWLTTERRQRHLAAEWLRYTRVSFDCAEFDSADAAREAVLCAQEEQLDLAAVARMNGFPCRRANEFLSAVPAAWAELLTSARPGDLQLPPARHDDFVVLALQSRTEPTLADEAVRTRIDRAVVEQALRECESRQIRWVIAVGGGS